MSGNFNALLKHGYKSVHYVKAHLVAKCFNQHHKLDYVKTFNLVLKCDTPNCMDSFGLDCLNVCCAGVC